MDIRFLSTFLEVVKTRHFGKAAENLYLTQSAVSARIKLLEEYFQTTLFIRHRNSIQLTPAGEKLLPFAHQLTDTLQDAKRELQLQSAEFVVCAATQLASELGFTSLLGKIHTAYPDWSVKAEVLTLDSLSRQLHERTIDIALSSEPLKSEEINTVKLLHIPLALYAFDTDLESPDPTTFVSIEWGLKVREFLHKEFSGLRDARLRTNSLRLAANSLLEEGGFAILPESMAERLLPAAGLRKLERWNGFSTTVYLNTMKSVKRPGLPPLIALLTA
ncbi:LysR family transcriptional regulator [Aestuariibacter sp. A3R04]|uniref:LysR family transcriptional regulator n=1 Tax=Aestuariibacter sp. A3R04 TaxID=2841571 RepID=UPI001C08175E|nr:LysR family transcriptional regulator [Aestuariibacter sp. A3R04]MBU3023212.1 LysR family transcriptional regulator [Aestuariibacter sp. A3R04]